MDVHKLSVTYGNGNQIFISAKGVSDIDAVKYLITAPGKLEFRKVDINLTQQFNSTSLNSNQLPADEQLLFLQTNNETVAESNQPERYAFIIDKSPLLENNEIAESTLESDSYGRHQVVIKFTASGARQFESITDKLAKLGEETGGVQKLAIVIDGKLKQVDNVRERISTDKTVIEFQQGTPLIEVQKTVAILQPETMPFELRIISVDESRDGLNISDTF